MRNTYKEASVGIWAIFICTTIALLVLFVGAQIFIR